VDPTAYVDVNDADSTDGAEVPAAFVAVTVNLYEVPSVSPETVIWPELTWDTVRMAAAPAGLEVAV
jgi:hypothetical protein